MTKRNTVIGHSINPIQKFAYGDITYVLSSLS